MQALHHTDTVLINQIIQYFNAEYVDNQIYFEDYLLGDVDLRTIVEDNCQTVFEIIEYRQHTHMDNSCNDGVLGCEGTGSKCDSSDTDSVGPPFGDCGSQDNKASCSDSDSERHDFDSDFTGHDAWYWRMQEVRAVVKLRARLKPFHMLHAGCDPNIFNYCGQSPSDYAEISKLMSEWRWALKHNGYVLDETTNLWVRPNSANEMLEDIVAERS